MPLETTSRSCGALLHMSSLPSRYGIGDLGPDAHAFAETLAAAGLRYWQFLPLSPTSTFIGNSPYSSPSAFACNPLLISPELLVQDGFISDADLDESLRRSRADFGADLTANNNRVNFEQVTAQREALLNTAFDNVQKRLPTLESDSAYRAFLEQNDDWLEDYALFEAIKEAHGGSCWTDWPLQLKNRDPQALEEWKTQNPLAVNRQKFIQYLFQSQWNRLHDRCRRLGVRLVGDLPIYVTHDSADVWTRPDLFKLDAAGQSLAVSGVPPDYFSETGQRWGNPVFDWEKMRAENFAWWIRRLRHNLDLADVVRLDHFRGFCAYWEIPAEEATAVRGRWVKAPGRELFTVLSKHFGYLPLIAEDLGVITKDVEDLMEEFGLPGMKVLQFGFGGEAGGNTNTPYQHPRHSVVYTGTHDNPTTRQWFSEAPEGEKRNFINYRGQDLDDSYANEVLMRMALESQAGLAVLPMQDILRLGAEGRMNTPSQPENNWAWRLTDKKGWLAEEFWHDRLPDNLLGEPPAPQATRNGGATEESTPVDPEAAIGIDGSSPDYPLDFSAGHNNNPEPASAKSRAPVPDVFGHIHFLCGVYGRL